MTIWLDVVSCLCVIFLAQPHGLNNMRKHGKLEDGGLATEKQQVGYIRQSGWRCGRSFQTTHIAGFLPHQSAKRVQIKIHSVVWDSCRHCNLTLRIKLLLNEKLARGNCQTKSAASTNQTASSCAKFMQTLQFEPLGLDEGSSRSKTCPKPYLPNQICRVFADQPDESADQTASSCSSVMQMLCVYVVIGHNYICYASVIGNRVNVNKKRRDPGHMGQFLQGGNFGCFVSLFF